MMEVLKTRHIGFCFGVRRAIDMVMAEAEKEKGRIYTLGPIIHNPQMVEMLKEKGIIPIEDLREVREGTVVFRTHGIKKEEEEYIREKGLNFIDATCPFVKRVRKKAMFLEKNRYKVVIVGDREHPEVKSVLSYLHNNGIVLEKPTPIKAKKVGVVSQTTHGRESFFNIVSRLVEEVEELRVYNTICESTETRQKEAASLASMVDIMLIIGGKNSSNTTKLYETVKRENCKAYHIETEAEIDPEWFKGVNKIGITGGTSTPDHILDSVERFVKKL
ncbi:MAG: 4-hydroxy-3-methylbut-2-enyl diphosphate reductase [Syntrophorhabdaceae bacterium]|nr:4-hydroxy-3-methylbut-2-enyl diphosphate reductase [Syntrophorhabdaceae bacterium]